jgi:hypothetical protein
MSAIAGIGLFCTGLVLSYLNSTTANFFWSSIYVGGVAVTTLAMLAKLAVAFGVENGFVVASDKVSSIVPWVALYFDGIQALHFKHDGLDGFMACFAIITLGIVFFSGVTDSVASLIGKKYRDATEALAEGAHRAAAAADALGGRH